MGTSRNIVLPDASISLAERAHRREKGGSACFSFGANRGVDCLDSTEILYERGLRSGVQVTASLRMVDEVVITITSATVG